MTFRFRTYLKREQEEKRKNNLVRRCENLVNVFESPLAKYFCGMERTG